MQQRQSNNHLYKVSKLMIVRGTDKCHHIRQLSPPPVQLARNTHSHTQMASMQSLRCSQTNRPVQYPPLLLEKTKQVESPNNPPCLHPVTPPLHYPYTELTVACKETCMSCSHIHMMMTNVLHKIRTRHMPDVKGAAPTLSSLYLRQTSP